MNQGAHLSTGALLLAAVHNTHEQVFGSDGQMRTSAVD